MVRSQVASLSASCLDLLNTLVSLTLNTEPLVVVFVGQRLIRVIVISMK